MKTKETPIPLSPALLEPHPDNPRIFFRDEVVERIAQQLTTTGAFDPAHALIVRPLGKRYQIVAGHHRKAAAEKARLDSVPCWVRELSDEESLYLLLTSNDQSDLAPLEVGRHVLACVPDGERGRGKRGGLRDYARRVGRDEGNLRRMRDGAVVFEAVQNAAILPHFIDKCYHLAAVYHAPQAAWAALAAWLVKKEKPVADVEAKVKQIAVAIKQIPPLLANYLPADLVAVSVVRDKTPGAIAGLVEQATRGLQMAEQLDVIRGDGKSSEHSAFMEWLISGRPHEDVGELEPTEDNHLGIGDESGNTARPGQGTVGDSRTTAWDSWDIQVLTAKVRELDVLLAEARRQQPVIALADALDYLGGLADQSVDLLLTDPPYMTDVDDIASFASTWVALALAKVKSTGRAYIFTGSYVAELAAYGNAFLALEDGWVLDGPLVWAYQNTLGPSPTHGYKRNWQACFHLYRKDSPPLDCPLLLEQFMVQVVNAPGNYGSKEDRFHAWQKPAELAERLVRHGSHTNAVVLDCFAGTGSLLLAASKLGRSAIGCERDPEMLRLAEQRGCRRG